MSVRLSLAVFDCSENEVGVFTMDSDPSVECWTGSGEHQLLFYAGIVTLGLYGAGVPLLIGFMLWRNRHGIVLDQHMFAIGTGGSTVRRHLVPTGDCGKWQGDGWGSAEVEVVAVALPVAPGLAPDNPPCIMIGSHRPTGNQPVPSDAQTVPQAVQGLPSSVLLLAPGAHQPQVRAGADDDPVQHSSAVSGEHPRWDGVRCFVRISHSLVRGLSLRFTGDPFGHGPVPIVCAAFSRPAVPNEASLR